MFRVFLLAVFMILCFTEIKAQDSTHIKNKNLQVGKIGVGPELGYFKSGDADQGSIMLGGFIRARILEQVGLDLSVSYKTEHYASGRVQVSQWPVQLSGLYYPMPSVYLLAGVGLYFTTFSFNSQSIIDLPDKSASRFGFHVGAGLELEMTPKLKFTGDIKYVLLGLGLDNFGTIQASDLNANYYVITIGAMYIL